MTKITNADRVLETSTSTGTGDIVVAGALPGFQPFDDKLDSGLPDTADIVVFAVDGGVPSGQWQSFLGTYSAANTLERTTIIDGSDGVGVAVDFDAGTKHVMLIERGGNGLVKLGSFTAPGSGYQMGVGSIPSIFDDLVIVVTGRSDDATDTTDITLSLSTDNAWAFDAARTTTAGTTVTADEVLGGNGSSSFARVAAGNAPAGAIGSFTLEILDYAGPLHKGLLFNGAVRYGVGTGETEKVAMSGTFSTTDPILGVSVNTASGSWVAGSKLVVYGRGGG